jgi:hypothetical protein
MQCAAAPSVHSVGMLGDATLLLTLVPIQTYTDKSQSPNFFGHHILSNTIAAKYPCGDLTPSRAQLPPTTHTAAHKQSGHASQPASQPGSTNNSAITPHWHTVQGTQYLVHSTGSQRSSRSWRHKGQPYVWSAHGLMIQPGVTAAGACGRNSDTVWF